MTEKQKEVLMNKIEDLFQAEIAQISEHNNKSCNVFKIVGCENDELKHSSFTRWLLYNDAFFKRFLSVCDIKLTSEQIAEHRIIKKEESYSVNDLHEDGIPVSKDLYEENKSSRRIDLNIIGESYSITIENKVDTGEHNDQCISYYNYMLDTKGKYTEIKDKYFVFLAKKEDEENFKKRGGLLRDVGGEIVEHDTSVLLANLEEVASVRNSEERKKLEEALENASKDEQKIIKGKIAEMDSKTPKMSLFNYRLFDYKRILSIVESENFEEDFIKEYKKNNADWKENDIVFVKQILSQYTKLIAEWSKIPEEYKTLFDDLSQEQEDLLEEIIENFDFLYKDEQDSDIGCFLETAMKCHIEKKNLYDNLIKNILKELGGDDAKVDTYQYAGSLEAPKSCPMIRTIDYAAINGISVNMNAGLDNGKSDKLVSYMKTDDEFFEKLNAMPGARLIFWIRKGQRGEIYKLDYDIAKITEALPKEKALREEFISKLFPIDIKARRYVNPKLAQECSKATEKPQEKAPVIDSEGNNIIVKYINDNRDYFKEEQVSECIKMITEHQNANPLNSFLPLFILKVQSKFSGNVDDDKAIKEFFVNATESELGLFGGKIEEMIPGYRRN